MVEFLSEDEVSCELVEVSKIEDVDVGVQRAPLNNLTDATFELLLWDIFCMRNSKEYYDSATLMVAGADQGRDVWLTRNGEGPKKAWVY